MNKYVTVFQIQKQKDILAKKDLKIQQLQSELTVSMAIMYVCSNCLHLRYFPIKYVKATLNSYSLHNFFLYRDVKFIADDKKYCDRPTNPYVSF